MTDPGRFRALVLATSTTGALTFCVAEPAPGLALLVLAAAVASALLTRGPQPIVAPRLALNILVMTATLWALLNAVGGRATELISTLSTFLVHILIIKLFDRRHVRDEAQLLGLSVFVAVGATLTSAMLALGAMILVFTPLAITSFIALTLASGRERMNQRREAAGEPTAEPATQPAPGRRRRDLALVAGACMMLSLALSVAAFVITPRNLVPSLSSWADRAGMTQTGFTDSIELGRGGAINESPRQVMEVTLLATSGEADRSAATLYLRGAILDSYDPGAGTWTRSAGLDELALRSIDLERGQTGLLDVPAIATPGSTAEPRVRGQQISIRNQRSTGHLFALYRPVRVSAESAGKVTMSPTGTLFFERLGPPAPLTYTVWSSEYQPELPTTTDRRPRSGARPGQARLAPAQAENPFRNGPIRDLALSLLAPADLPADPAAREPGDSRRAVLAFVRHLQRTCTYTLENPAPPAGQDPIEAFIFTTRRGHCEYFASALAALCMSVEIPARVVTGYAAGEFNSVTGRYTVRESDAHAWVECSFADARWETIDPTPPDRLPHAQRQTGGVLSLLRQLYEALEFSWFDNVIAFERRGGGPLSFGPDGLGPGSPALRSIREFFNSITDRLKELIPRDGIGRFVGIFLTIAALVALAWALYAACRALALWLSRWSARRRRPGPPRLPGPAGEWTRYYAHMLDLLDRAGHPKPPATPPLAFAHQLRRAGLPFAEPVAELSHRYYAIRFGGRTPADDHAQVIDAQMRALRQHLDAKPPRSSTPL